ncbi:MAG: hypothetical protein KF887_17875 [Paracoccaceae bacterium]|nr:MAG: hypothetical protein KF887_17875 [Paracoccaceae bacterium]
MTWWDHAVMMRLRLGPWAGPVALRHHEQEAADIAAARAADDAAAAAARMSRTARPDDGCGA